MKKQHLQHLNRAVVLCSEILGMAVLVLFTAWLLLITRLSQGPLQVDFLTKSIERSFNKEQAGFRFSIGSTVLTWGGTGQPLVFEMDHVQIVRDDKTPVLSVDKIGVQLSKRHLVFGEIVPRVIRVYGPALRVVRSEDSRFTLNINGNGAGDNGAASAAPSPVTSPPAPVTAPAAVAGSQENLVQSSPGQIELIKGILAQMHESSRSTFLGGLDEISVNGAALLYEDKILNVSWKSNKADLDFARGHDGLDIDALVNIAQDARHMAVIHSNFSYDWNTRRSKGTVSFTNFNPSLLAQQSDTLRNLSGIDLPLKGSVYMTLDENFNPGYGRIALGADPGRFSLPGLYADPLPVDRFYMEGKFDASAGEMALEQLRADLGGPKVTASGSITQQATGHGLSITASLEGLPLDKLKNYWPASLTPDPRAWVTGHLSAGIATKATLDLALMFPHICTATCPRPWDDFGAAQVQKLGGQIDFNGIKVDYFPPLMPVLKVKGKATYDQKSFHLDLTGGALGDMKVTHSKIDITDLDIADEKTHSKIDVTVALEGPLKTALKVLGSKPLQYPEKLGIQTADVAGNAAVDVNFKFPLYSKLAVDEVKVTAKAKLDNVLLNGMVAGLPLSGGPMDLSLGNGALNIKGKGLLGKMPVTFDWLKNFSAKAPVESKVEASLPLDPEALKAFGVPDDLKIAGSLPATVIYTAAGNHTATLAFKGDVTPTGFTLPVAGFEKPPQVSGTLDMLLRFKNGALSRIDDLSLTTDKLRLKGSAGFASDGKTLKNADFKQVKLDDTDVSLAVASRGSDGYDVKISGAQFDATKFLSEDNAPNSDAAAAVRTPPLALSMAVDRLITGPGRSLIKLRLFMRRNIWSRIDQLQVDGVSGGQPLTLRYMPVANGHTLNFEADNAGAALSAMGITNGVRGGKILVNGAPDRPVAGGRDLRGSVIMTDFSLVNVPVLGRLLNALSLSGIIELLNGKGIAFKKMRSDFWWTDRGQPDSFKNARTITLRNGQTSGASLGLTFDGQIDNWRNTLDMSGTIIPVSDLNKMLSFVPLVGDILTGGGKGVFAATYTVKGPKNDPDVSVNPLSVLAPGILRKVFFEH